MSSKSGDQERADLQEMDRSLQAELAARA